MVGAPYQTTENLIDDLRNDPICHSPEWCAGDGARVLIENINTDDEFEMDALRQFEFISKAGSLGKCDALLIDDEYDSLKAAFMPDEYILSNDYDEQGVAFLRMCRGDGRIKTKTLVEHAVRAIDVARQVAVLKYLANGNPADDFKDAIRKAMSDGGWLYDWIHGLAAKELSNSERDAVARALSISEDAYDAMMRLAYAMGSDDSFEDDASQETGATIAEQLETKSKWTRQDELAYNRELYDRDEVCTLECDLSKPDMRSEWMEVLVVAAAHTLGLKECQHRGYVAWLQGRGYWDVYCKKDIDVNRWFGTIDDSLVKANYNAQFMHWMKLFFRIYQFARHLDAYVQVFSMFDDITDEHYFDVFNFNDPIYTNTGIDAPSLDRALGRSGKEFLIKEMYRRGAISNRRLVDRYCRR